MVTTINNKFQVFLIEHGTKRIFCNYRQIKKVLSDKELQNDIKPVIYEFVENTKSFKITTLEKIESWKK